jgi:carbamoyltransferase
MRIVCFNVGHDSSISYYDGEYVHYVKLERENHEKHSGGSASHCIHTFEKKFNIKIQDVDAVGVDYQLVAQIPGSAKDILLIPSVDKPTKFTKELVDLNLIPNKNCWLVPHHASHIHSSWVMDCNPDKYISVDGVGEWRVWGAYDKQMNVLDYGTIHSMEPDGSNFHRHGSIGHNLIDVATFMGINGYEVDLVGKLMGLQSYGNINHKFLEHIRQWNIRECYDMFDPKQYMNFTDFKTTEKNMSEEAMHHNGSMQDKVIRQEHLNWVKTLFARCEEMILELFDEFCEPGETVAYSGGVALNVLWNTELRKKYNVVPLPHCADEGLSLGMIEIMRKQFNLPKLKLRNFPYCQSDEYGGVATIDTIKKAAKHLSEGKIIAWYQRNGEIGPRALGNRSLLFDPRVPNGKDIINKIKEREGYRPFGGSVLQNHMYDAFDEIAEDKYMLFHAKPTINVPSITHVDGTCRVQTVGDENPTFKTLLEEFYKLTGCPVLLNTSLNLGGNPICSNIWEVEQLMASTEIDYAYVGDREIVGAINMPPVNYFEHEYK